MRWRAGAPRVSCRDKVRNAGACGGEQGRRVEVVGINILAT